ncbi:ABC transporter substrate-binding protein [Bifidobacterium callitrichos]|nr:ABC transporter substrate-binding protein [Bifidobacterium callitrichos]
MKFTTKKAVAVIGAAAMLVSVAACGGSAGDSDSQSSSGGKTEITVWGWEPTLKQATAAFEKKYPDIKVKVTNVGTSAQTQTALTNAKQAGSGLPDVTQLEYHSMQQYVYEGVLKDITDKTSGYESFYNEGPWKDVQAGGKVYGLPMDSGPNALFYNKEIFDKAGVTEAPKTWEEYYEAAKKIHALGDNYYITSDAGDASQSTTFFSYLWQAGADPFKVDGENVSVDLKNNDKVKTVTDYWQKMIDEGLIDTKTTSWSDDWNRGLGDGTIASLVIGAWMPANLLSGAPNASGKFRVATTPQWNEGDDSNGENGGSMLGVVEGTKNEDAAWKYIEFVNHDAEGIKARTDAGAFPADKATLSSDDFLKGSDALTEYFGGQEYAKVLAEAAGQKVPDFQFLPYWGWAQTSFGDYFGQVYSSKKGTLSDAVASYQKAIVEHGNQQGFTVKES